MSTFFKALERAEQERTLRQPPAPTPSTPVAEPTPTPAAPEAPAARESHPFSKPPVPRPSREVVSKADSGGEELEEHLVSLLAPTSFGAEQYRALRHMVEQLHRSSDLSVIAVSSPDAGDGKTTTAINLAGALAQASDTRVLLIDADLRAASLGLHLGLGEFDTPGLVDAIMNPNLTLDAVVQRHPHLNLSVLTAGRRPAAPYEVLKSSRVTELLSEARRNFDYVIVDTPPLVSVPDGRIIGKSIDGFLIVVAAHRTPRKLLEEALNLLEPVKILGMVFNGDDRHLSRSSYESRRRRIVSSKTQKRQTASDD